MKARKLLILSKHDKSSKTPATAITLLITLSLLASILFISLAKAPTWVLTNTQAEFNEGTYVNVSSNSTGVVKFIRELPNNRSDESANGGANMTGNVLLMHFNNDSAYGENNTFAYDFSGMGNNGTFLNYPNNATYNSSGKFGSALSFDGINDYVKTVSDMTTGGTTSFEAWFYPRQGTALGKIIWIGSDGTNYANCDWADADYTIGCTLINAAGDDIYISPYGILSPILSLNTWHHMVFTWNSSAGILYINGVEVNRSNGNFSTFTETDEIYIGALNPAVASQYFNGTIDEVAIYNRSLSAAEISAHYNRSVATHGTYESKVFDANATASWKNLTWTESVPYREELPNNQYDEKNAGILGGANMTGNVLLMHLNNDTAFGDNGTNAYDYSGNGNNGTISGATWNTSGKFGNALSFDAENENVSITLTSSNRQYFNTSAFAYELWYRPSAALTPNGANDFLHLMGIVVTTNTRELSYGRYTADPYRGIVFYLSNSFIINYNTNLNANQWYHIVGTTDGSTARIYLNGVLVNQTAGSSGDPPVNSVFTIGDHSTWSNFVNANGTIDEVAIYNRSLSATEILEHYKRGILNLTFQVRSDDDNASWMDYIGPDNTSSSYFTNATLANLSLTNLSNARYFQYKAYFETNDTQNTTYTPELWNVSVSYEDAVAPNITNMTISPSAAADIDPNVRINVTVNVTDVSPGIDTVILRYWNYSTNVSTSSNVTMSSAGGNLYNASFTPDVNGTWYYQIWANDSAGNSINNTPNSTNVQYDCTWNMSYNIQNASGVLESTSVIGNITLNNTGDVEYYNNNCTIRFKIDEIEMARDGLKFKGIGESEEVFIVPYLYAEGVLGVASGIVNVTAYFASVEKENENFIISVTDMWSRSDTYQSNITGYINSVPGGPYLKPHIDALASINQSSSANLTAYVQNIGNETATNVTFNWTLPTGFTNSSGALNNNLTSLANKTAAPDNIHYYNLTITTDHTATYGTTYIYVNASCAQNVSGCSSRSYNISVNVKCSPSDGKCGNGCVYDSTKDNHDLDCYVAPTIVTVTIGGGGGAPAVAEIVSEATYELIRGKDKTFSLEVRNLFKDASLKEIKMKVAGYLAQYISIEPSTLDEIAPNSSFNFTIYITAPAYFTVGEHNLTFTIDSMKEVGVMKTARVEKRYVTLEIHELGREDATQLIALSKDYIEKMRALELNIKEVRSLLEQSQEALEKSNYEKVQEFSEKIKIIATIALESYNKIVELDKKIKDAESRGIRVESTRRMLGLAKAASERGDYMLALERAKDAEMTYALETKGEFNLFYFIAQNTLQFFFGMIIALALLTILFFRVKLSVISHSLGGLREEEGILLGLMKTTQHECFVEKKLSMREYFQSMTQYEDKLSKAIQRSIALESAKASLFKFKRAKLELEKKRLLDLMKETQRQYIKEGKIETRVYTNRMHSYSTRLSEVEEELATREAERALRIDKLHRFLQFVAFLKVFKISKRERAKLLEERRKKKAMIEELEKEKEKLQREELLEKLKLKEAEELKKRAAIERALREKLEERFLIIAAREEERQKMLALKRKLERPKEIRIEEEEKLRRERELEAKRREEAEKREKALKRFEIISAEEEKRREELARKREIEELKRIKREEKEKLQRERELEMLTRREEEEKLRHEKELEAKKREEAEKRRKILERFRKEEEKKEREEREKLRKVGLEKIKEYIQQTEKMGFSNEQIKAKLEERGWPAKLIKKAFKESRKKAKKEG